MGTHRIPGWLGSLGAALVPLTLAALPALAGPTPLGWTQPAGPAASLFRVYVGATPGAGEIVFEGLPIPDAEGAYSADVQIDEIDQGLPVYVWVTARNAAGESPPSNATFYADCDLQLDADCDGIPDDGAPGNVPCATGQTSGCDDNCPYTANPGQGDTAGVGLISRPDGIGNECQCGDVDADGRVSPFDAGMIGRAIRIPQVGTLTRPDLCDVGGPLGCSIVDYAIVLQSQNTPPTATVFQQCEAASPLP